MIKWLVLLFNILEDTVENLVKIKKKNWLWCLKIIRD